MRTLALVSIAAIVGLSGATAHAAVAPQTSTGAGLVYRWYAGSGYRFQPLLSFAQLNARVSAHDAPGARRLANALLARATRDADALVWKYDFPFGGSGAGWTSGFTQAVAAQALARTAVLLDDPAYAAAGDAAFRALERGLVMRLGGGLWIREYGFTRQVILNAQLQSILALESYARLAQTPAATRTAAAVRVAAARLLPRFDLGCWGRYQLGGAPADVHYQTYHVELLRQLAARHAEPVWQSTYLRWRRCLLGAGA
jgi:D-glucuronyl C5-epimerase-like protein